MTGSAKRRKTLTELRQEQRARRQQAAEATEQSQPPPPSTTHFTRPAQSIPRPLSRSNTPQRFSNVLSNLDQIADFSLESSEDGAGQAIIRDGPQVAETNEDLLRMTLNDLRGDWSLKKSVNFRANFDLGWVKSTSQSIRTGAQMHATTLSDVEKNPLAAWFRACVAHVHPPSPWTRRTKGAVADSSDQTLDQRQEELHRWRQAFRSLYYSWRHGHCHSFYLKATFYTVLWRVQKYPNDQDEEDKPECGEEGGRGDHAPLGGEEEGEKTYSEAGQDWGGDAKSAPERERRKGKWDEASNGKREGMQGSKAAVPTIPRWRQHVVEAVMSTSSQQLRQRFRSAQVAFSMPGCQSTGMSETDKRQEEGRRELDALERSAPGSTRLSRRTSRTADGSEESTRLLFQGHMAVGGLFQVLLECSEAAAVRGWGPAMAGLAAAGGNLRRSNSSTGSTAPGDSPLASERPPLLVADLPFLFSTAEPLVVDYSGAVTDTSGGLVRRRQHIEVRGLITPLAHRALCGAMANLAADASAVEAGEDKWFVASFESDKSTLVFALDGKEERREIPAPGHWPHGAKASPERAKATNHLVRKLEWDGEVKEGTYHRFLVQRERAPGAWWNTSPSPS